MDVPLGTRRIAWPAAAALAPAAGDPAPAVAAPWRAPPAVREAAV